MNEKFEFLDLLHISFGTQVIYLQEEVEQYGVKRETYGRWISNYKPYYYTEEKVRECEGYLINNYEEVCRAIKEFYSNNPEILDNFSRFNYGLQEFLGKTLSCPSDFYCGWFVMGKKDFHQYGLIQRGGEKKMNQVIVEMFPKTKDAVLIDKWFGSKISSDPLMAMLIKGKEKELLEEAKRLQEQEDARKAK